IGTRVVIGRVQSRVPEPITDHGHVDTSSNELDAGTVTPGVRRDALCSERWHVPSGRLNILFELEAHARSTKRLAISVYEEGLLIGARLPFQQRFEQVHCFRPQWAGSRLASLSE